MDYNDDSVSTVIRFIECINAGDSRKLVTLQTEGFTLIDMEGEKSVGRDGWESYFSDYPDYRIHVEKFLLSGDSVAVVGKTTGSHVDSRVEVLETVLWVAEVREGLVAYWRIYSDFDEAKGELLDTS
jgi:ketosteroid isomerase-like protein